MSDLAVAGDIADGGKPALLDVAQVVRRARQALTVGGSPRWARDIVLAGLDKFGRSADLLWVLAEIEFIDGDVAAGRDAMKEASTLDPTSPASIIKSLRMLGGSGCWQEALAIILSIPASMHQEPLVRTESGNFYWLCKCPAHAVAAFGKPKDLPRQSRKVWLSCWLRSGGPVNSLRRRALSWEAEALQVLDEPPPHVEAICGVPELDPRQVLRVRVSLEKYNFRFARIFFHEIAWRRTAFRLLPLVAILVWIGLIYFVRAYVVASYPQDLSDFILSAAVGIVPFFFFARLWFDSRGWSRVSRGRMGAHLMVFLAGVAAVNLAFSRASISDQSRDGAVLSGLMSGVLLLTCLNLAATLNEIYGDRRIRRIIREDPLISMTDQLLLVLTGLRSSSGYHGMHERRYHARLLEWAARTLNQYMMSRSTSKFLGSGDWLARRLAGWAEALRYAQRQVLAPVPDGQGKLEAFLVHEIRCLACGDLGALTWREPPPGESRRATLQRRALSLARTVVVAALPLVAVLAAHSLLHFSADLFNWGRIMTASWALLCVLLSIDPTIRDKVSVAKDLADLVRPSKPGT